MSSVMLGIDGGGTRTRAVLTDVSGRPLGRGESGPGNWHDIGEAQASQNLREAVACAWSEAGVAPRPIASVYLGIAGTITDEDRAAVHRMAQRLTLTPQAVIGVGHDLDAAHASVFEDGPGVVLISGTGSSCYGTTGDGRSLLVGGWGSTLDDEGSGYWIGVQGLRAVARAVDGRSGTTALVDDALQTYNVQSLRALMAMMDGKPDRRSNAARFAPCVLRRAEEGDPTACQIIDQAVGELTDLVNTMVQRLFSGQSEGVPVAAVGGLMACGTAFCERVWKAIIHRCPGIARHQPTRSASEGAAWLARRQFLAHPQPVVLQKTPTPPHPHRGRHPETGQSSAALPLHLRP